MIDGRNYRYRGKILVDRPSGKYRQVCLVDGSGNKKYSLVHRLVLEAFIGPCPPGMECRHLNGNRSDNRLENLCWGTRIENVEDKRKHGTILRGEMNPNAKLTADTVIQIREDWNWE
ncbi:MAG: HNH endonuclease [Patescibacteria group bacterium]|nr:HNH endonuclease [Patescibacteria group bacterium]